ncbi:glycosyltransferase family 2 protein [Glutamicibacter arilaitensis]|uniref:glycosyltransferase family 2 protein n=1 Tax=Glutamicibacter arilaitensis TaxID=256701 RepID=UPI003FD18C1C
MRPLLSVLIAAFNVENYIAATLKSIDRQSADLSNVEFIIVDDGSQDLTAEIADNWSLGKPNVKVIRQKNLGVSGARQTALDNASGIWVTSVDPDDIIDRDYVGQIVKFALGTASHDVHLMVTNVISMNDATGRLNNNHPLRKRFDRGTRLIALADEPQSIQLGATAVMRLDDIRQYGIEYDLKVRPTFEDAHFLGRYLAYSVAPKVAVLAEAKYYYRRRNNVSSLVQTSWGSVHKYSTVLEYGYIGLLEETKRIAGVVPLWTQYMVLYDLCWYFVISAGISLRILNNFREPRGFPTK